MVFCIFGQIIQKHGLALGGRDRVRIRCSAAHLPLWAICFEHGKETAKEIAAIKAEELIALTLHCHTPFRCFPQYSVLV